MKRSKTQKPDQLASVLNADPDSPLANDPVLPDLIGLSAPDVILGHTLRPVSMTTIGLLSRARSELVAGKPPSEMEDFSLETVLYFLVQRGTLADGIAMAQHIGSLDGVERMQFLYEQADLIPARDGVKLISLVSEVLNKAFSTQVEVVSEKGATTSPKSRPRRGV